MTYQATNRREGVSMSCHGRSRKLHAFTDKELDVMRAAQELLGAPTIGRGSARPGGQWWSESKKSNKPSKPPKIYKNSTKTAGFLHLLTLKSPKMPFFT